MALKEVAVQGCTLTYDPPVTGAPASFVTAPSTKVIAAGSGVYLDGAQIQIPAGVTNGSCTTSAIAYGNIDATATKVNAEATPVLRVDDLVTVQNIPGSTGGGSGCSLTVTVRITNAGQTKVRAQ